MRYFSKHKEIVVAILGIVALYLVTHLFKLTVLPVFADESIYVRWAQLIMDEPARYALFPLNDGKTPLFIWALVPLQYLFSDQLFAARILSVVVGLGQVFAIGWLIRLFGGKKQTAFLGMLMTTLLPYWYVHHRVALMDGAMTLWLSLAVGGVLKIAEQKINAKKLFSFENLKKDWPWILFAGVFFGLALLTKLPGILFAPILFLVGWGWLIIKKGFDFEKLFYLSIKIGMSVGLGFLMFITLKLHPAFGQLFSRGSDFLFPLGEVLGGAWRETIISVPNYLKYFIAYLTLPVILLNVIGLFSPKNKKTHHLLLFLALAFLAPIMLMGRVVYPRYLFPASIFLTVSAALVFENFYLFLDSKKNLLKKTLVQLILILFLANMLAVSGVFVYQSMFEVDKTPFVPADKVQYLYEWSSGHGIVETVELIQSMAQKQTVAVATEGFFGTLPDAILMYLHDRDVTNIYVAGIGQPVAEIPEDFLERAQNFERKLLVVNSHRMRMDLAPEKLIAEFCRPDNAPCLQIWDVGD